MTGRPVTVSRQYFRESCCYHTFGFAGNSCKTAADIIQVALNLSLKALSTSCNLQTFAAAYLALLLLLDRWPCTFLASPVSPCNLQTLRAACTEPVAFFLWPDC